MSGGRPGLARAYAALGSGLRCCKGVSFLKARTPASPCKACITHLPLPTCTARHGSYLLAVLEPVLSICWLPSDRCRRPCRRNTSFANLTSCPAQCAYEWNGFPYNNKTTPVFTLARVNGTCPAAPNATVIEDPSAVDGESDLCNSSWKAAFVSRPAALALAPPPPRQLRHSS